MFLFSRSLIAEIESVVTGRAPTPCIPLMKWLHDRSAVCCFCLRRRWQEAWANLGSLLRDWGKGKEALIAFDNAIVLDSAYVHAYHLRGVCKHGMGDHKGAQADFMRGQFYDSQVLND